MLNSNVSHGDIIVVSRKEFKSTVASFADITNTEMGRNNFKIICTYFSKFDDMVCFQYNNNPVKYCINKKYILGKINVNFKGK